jgi:uncharacterized membrane protein
LPAIPPQNPQGRREISISHELNTWSGPLPPPETLEKYEQITAGLADRLVRMAENQSAHRQKLEKRVLDADIIKSFLGILAATIIVLAGISGGVIVSLYGNSSNTDLLGAFIPILTVGAVAWVAIVNKKAQAASLPLNRERSLEPPQKK